MYVPRQPGPHFLRQCSLTPASHTALHPRQTQVKQTLQKDRHTDKWHEDRDEETDRQRDNTEMDRQASRQMVCMYVYKGTSLYRDSELGTPP